MRFLLLLIASLLTLPTFAQSIHRATQIDLEQDQRLDNLESELESLTKSIETLAKSIDAKSETLVSQPVEEAKSVLEEAPKPIEDPKPNASEPSNEPRYCIGDTKYCEGRLHYLACVNGEEKWLPVPAPSNQFATSKPMVQASTVAYSQPVVVSATTVTKSQPATVQRSVAVQSGRYTTSELRSLIQQYRNHRIYADVQPRSYAYKHLVQDHGFTSDQVNGLTLDEAYRLHSLAHGGIVKSYRSGQSVAMVQSSVESAIVYPAVTYSQPVYQQSQPVQRPQPVRTVIQAAANGCPNGKCPTQRSNQSWSLFGRWR